MEENEEEYKEVKEEELEGKKSEGVTVTSHRCKGA